MELRKSAEQPPNTEETVFYIVQRVFNPSAKAGEGTYMACEMSVGEAELLHGLNERIRSVSDIRRPNGPDGIEGDVGLLRDSRRGETLNELYREYDEEWKRHDRRISYLITNTNLQDCSFVRKADLPKQEYRTQPVIERKKLKA